MDDEDETKSLVQSISVKLSSPRLATRLEAIEEANTLFHSSLCGDIKAGPLKRVARELLLCLAGGPAVRFVGNDGKFWSHELKSFFVKISLEQKNMEIQLPFDFVAYCVEFLTIKMESTRLHEAETITQIGSAAIMLLPNIPESCSNESISVTFELIGVLGDALNKLSNLQGISASQSYDGQKSRAALLYLQKSTISYLTRYPDMVSQFLGCWIGSLPSQNSTCSFCIPGIAVLFQACHSQPDSAMATMISENMNIRVVLLESILLAVNGTALSSSSISSAQCKSALSAASSVGSLISMNAFMQSVTPQEWSEIESHLLKQLKKNPESSAVVVATVCTNTLMCLDNLIREGLGIALPKMLRSSATEVRQAGLTLIETACRRCCDNSDSSTLVLLSVILCEALQGKPISAGGRLSMATGGGFLLTQENQKYAILQALGSCMSVLSKLGGSQGGEGGQVAINVVIEALLAAVEKEKEVPIKFREAELLSRWLLCCSSLTPELLSRFAKGITSKASAGPYLLTLSSMFSPPLSGNVCEYSTAIVEHDSLVPALLKCVTSSQMKPEVASVEGVLALRILLEVNAISSLPPPHLKELTSSLQKALPVEENGSGSSFLLTLSLHSQVAGRASSISAINNSPMGNGALEAILAIVGISYRDFGCSCNLFLPLKFTGIDRAEDCTESKIDPVTCLGYGLGYAARKLVVFSTNLLNDHALRKRACGYWVPIILRACSAFTSTQLSTVADRSNFAGSLSVLEEFNDQVRSASEYEELSRKEELFNFKGKDSGVGLALSVKVDCAASLFVQAPASRLSDSFFFYLCSSSRKSCTEVSDSLTARVFALSLHLTSHPALSSQSSKMTSKLYNRLIQEHLRLPSNASSLDTTIYQTLRDAVCEGVFSPQHAIANRQAGGQIALLLYGSTGGSTRNEIGRKLMIDDILPQLADELHCESINHFTLEDESVWKNPDYLMQEVERSITAGAGIDNIKITNADRKKTSSRTSRRGQFGSDLAEDDEWAAQVMKEKREKKLRDAHEAAQNSPEMANAIHRTNEIRHRVGLILQRSHTALGILRFLAENNCDLFKSLTIVLLTPLLDLLRSPLIYNDARETLGALIGALVQNSSLDKIKLDIGAALEIVSTIIFCQPPSGIVDKDSIFKEVICRAGPLVRCIHALHVISSQASSASKSASKHSVNVISTGCFQLVFPILRGVLSLKGQISGCEHAFVILESLWKHVTRTPASASSCRSLLRHMIEATLSVAARSGRIVSVAREVLLSLICDPLSPLEWTPLLGFTGLMCVEVAVRRLAISAVFELAKLENSIGRMNIPLSKRLCSQPLVVSRVWLSSYDVDEEVRSIASEVWTMSNMTLPSAFMTPLLPLLESESCPECNKQSAASALAAGMKIHPDQGLECLSTLEAIYTEALPQSTIPTTPLPIPRLSSENSAGSNKSGGSSSADLSIGAVRSSLSGGRNKIAASKKKPGAIDMSMIGMGAKKKLPAKKSSGIGAGIGTKSTKKKDADKDIEESVSVTEQISRVEKAVEDLNWQKRIVIACCYKAIGDEAAFLGNNNFDENGDGDRTIELLRCAFNFLLRDGVTDRKEEVRAKMVAAGRSLIDSYGMEFCDVIVGILEATLAEEQPVGKEELVKFDLRHEAVVILLGAAAKHLSKDDPNVKSIMESLVSSLSTPVESVQKAVADCLIPLVQSRKTEDRIKELIEELMTQIVDGDSYGARRGAAFGLSAFVKGSGISAIKNHDLVTRLKEFASTGGNNQRQGALFAFELLSDRLGMLFEPYVITIVPLLLKSFSHSSDHVREAAQLSAKSIMGRLSSHGVKQVLTPILQSLPEESQWKSRQEALRLLGSMAFCAPRQLASCLPQVIPRLVEAGSDPHPKVKEGAKSALTDISSVIRNPEVSRLSPILLKALTDPATHTKTALEALLECEFMHSIDAPSLALLVPILGRALKDRGGDLKRKSAVILGNMASMIADPKILSPYLSQVVPGLKEVLLDPIPDVRATAAKALGGLMLGMGEAEMPDLVPWCLSSLSVESSPVERSGAAQGLAEICHALGEARVMEILHDALKLQKSHSSASREGLLWFLAFLPAVLEERFADYIDETLPVVLQGLSDNTEGVREVAMRSGQVFVSCHGRNHSDEVLPPILKGMFDVDWRIRESSVSLLGELLYLIGEAKAVNMLNNMSDGGDMPEAGYLNSLSRVISTIRSHVGDDMADAILSSLYIVRSDNSISVRQCALQVWKTVVVNTPRVLREIMPTLVKQIISMLSNDDGYGSNEAFEPDFEDDVENEIEELGHTQNEATGKTFGASEQSTVAGRALGELVRKLGDHVLPLIIPYLRDGLSSTTDHLRQGVCLGLSEILKAASAKQITSYIDTLVPALQQAICDSSQHVRTLASQAFHALARAIGQQAFDSVLPPLLASVSNDYPDEQSYALKGLKDIALHRPRDLLEYTIPILLKTPLQAWAANALGHLASCAQKNIHHHLGTTSFLVEENCEDIDNMQREQDRLESIKKCAGAVVGSSTTAGINFLVSELGKQIEQATLDAHSTKVVVTSATTISPITCRRWGCWLVGQFFVNSNMSGESVTEYDEYIPLFLKFLLSRSADMDTETLKVIVDSLKSLTKSVPVDVLVTHIDFIRSCINLTASDAKHRVNKKDKDRLYDPVNGQFLLPLFRIPKALENLLPIFIHALMNGSVEAREAAATGIGELAVMTETPLLKPYLIKTTGPLIRVVGDRFPSNVKFAILSTLSVLLQKGGVGLKAFVPQLQTTFLKNISDASKQVRTQACECLGTLLPMSTRIDPVLNELSSGVQEAESSAISVSYAEGISVVLRAAGKKASAEVLEKISQSILVTALSEDEQVRTASSTSLGALAEIYSSEEHVSRLLYNLLPPDGNSSLSESGEHWTSLCGRLLSCGEVLHRSGALGLEMQSAVFNFFDLALVDSRVAVRVAVCVAIGTLSTFAHELDGNVQQVICEAILDRFAAKLAKAATRTGLADDSLEVRRAAVGAMKQLAKSFQPLCVPYAGLLSSALHPYVVPNAEINIRLKKSVERTLKYLLGIRSSQGLKSEASAFTATPASAAAAMQNVASTNAEVGRFMQQYANRVLTKLAEESDGGEW